MAGEEGLVRIASIIRGAGIIVVCLVAFAGSPERMWGEEGGRECTDYHIEFCIEDCMQDQGEACGEQIPGCAGRGKIECMDGALCEDEELHKLCIFGPPN